MESRWSLRDHPGPFAPVSLHETILYLPGLLATVLVGRLVLACLPPGLPGRHAVREMPVTLAVSFVLGLCVLMLEVRVIRELGNEPHVATFFLPWIALLVVRLVSIPGAMVPRHEPRTEAAGWLATVALVPALAAVFFAFPTELPLYGRAEIELDTRTAFWVLVDGLELSEVRRAALSFGLLSPASVAAIGVCVGHGLFVARRRPLSRRLLVATLLWTPALLEHATGRQERMLDVLLIATACALAIPWLRRADRRARAISILAFAALPLYDPARLSIAVCGLVALIVATAGPSRIGTVKLALAALAIALIRPGPLGLRQADFDFFMENPAIALGSHGLTPWVFLALVGLTLSFLRGKADGVRSVDPPRRELVFLVLFCTLSFCAQATLGPPARFPWPAELFPLLPALALIAGLSGSAPERP